eukprot:COSAG02_NODE_9281_length_2268_cov_3.037344_1_plen_141_part_00
MPSLTGGPDAAGAGDTVGTLNPVANAPEPERPTFRAHDQVPFQNQQPGVMRRAFDAGKGRAVDTMGMISKETKGELIGELGKYAGGTYILKGAIEQPIEQLEGDTPEEEAAKKKQEATAMQDRLLARQKAMKCAQRAGLP